MTEKMQTRFIVNGHVQGVGFRYFVYRTAEQLGLNGFTKNLFDGSVEVVAEGEKSKLMEMHEFLKQGPSRSRVDSVFVSNNEYTGTYIGFEIK